MSTDIQSTAVSYDIKVREVDPSYYCPSGYEDPETGAWVELMTEEEIADYYRRAEGKRFFRMVVVCNGRRTAFNTPWIGKDEDPTPALRRGAEALWRVFSATRPDITPPDKL